MDKSKFAVKTERSIEILNGVERQIGIRVVHFELCTRGVHTVVYLTWRTLAYIYRLIGNQLTFSSDYILYINNKSFCSTNLNIFS